MNALSTLASLLILLPVLLHGRDQDVLVFLVAGQSNALGYGKVRELDTAYEPNHVDLRNPQEDVLFYFGPTHLPTPGPARTLTSLQPTSGLDFGPEVTLGRVLADQLPSERIAIVKYAMPSTSLYLHWNPQSLENQAPPLFTSRNRAYSNFNTIVSEALNHLLQANYTPRITAMFWMQGESDTVLLQEHRYEQNLKYFIATIRGRYGNDLPFLIGEIAVDTPDHDIIRLAQRRVAASDRFTSFVPTEELTVPDGYHFDSTSQMELGRRFARAYLNRTTLKIDRHDLKSLRLRFNVRPNTMYQIQRNQDLLTNAWQPLAEVTADTDSISYLVDVGPSGPAIQFFRIVSP